MLCWNDLPVERLHGVFETLRTSLARHNRLRKPLVVEDSFVGEVGEPLVGMIAVDNLRNVVSKQADFYRALLLECERMLREDMLGPNLRAIEVFSSEYGLHFPMAADIVKLMSPFQVVMVGTDIERQIVELTMDKVISSLSKLGYTTTQRGDGPLFLAWYYMYAESLCELLKFFD